MGEDGLGALLRARRSGAGLTQEELAERSGLSVRTIRDLERGRVARPRRETVRLLATSLGLHEDDREELLRLARNASLSARSRPVDAELPAAPVAMAPVDGDAPHPAVVPPAGPARRETGGRGHGRRRAALYAVLLTALLTIMALSPRHGPRTAHLSHQRTTGGAAYAVRVGNDGLHPGGPSTIGDDLQVLHPVARGDTLIVTVALTGPGPGAVTVTDTAGNTYRAAGHIASGDDRRRLLLFAVVAAKPLDTLDQITVRWPRSADAHTAVDAFRGVTGAGPWTAARSITDHGGDTESFTSGSLPLCAAGDLLFTAVSTPDGPAPQLEAPWQPVRWEPLTPEEFLSPPLATAYRSVTSTDGHCAARGTTPVPWQSITLRLH